MNNNTIPTIYVIPGKLYFLMTTSQENHNLEYAQRGHVLKQFSTEYIVFFTEQNSLRKNYYNENI